MKQIIEKSLCDHCNKDITDKPHIKMDDNDSTGIWFGDIGRWINSHDKIFCSFKCFMKWLSKTHQMILDNMNNDD